MLVLLWILCTCDFNLSLLLKVTICLTCASWHANACSGLQLLCRHLRGIRYDLNQFSYLICTQDRMRGAIKFSPCFIVALQCGWRLCCGLGKYNFSRSRMMAKQFTVPLVAWSVLWMSSVGTTLGADCSEQLSPILFGTWVEVFVIAKLIEAKVERCIIDLRSAPFTCSIALRKDIPALNSLLHI